MTNAAPNLLATLAEYLALEATSETKHEYVNGEILAMAGGTPEHGRLAISIASELRQALRGKPCNVFSSDVRISVLATGLRAYPDVSVVCGPTVRDPEDKNSVVNPIVLVEVLSPSTESYDRGAKLAHYRRIPSLRDYILVPHDSKHLEHFHRNDDGSWTLRDVPLGGTLVLDSIGAAIRADDVFHDPVADQAS